MLYSYRMDVIIDFPIIFESLNLAYFALSLVSLVAFVSDIIFIDFNQRKNSIFIYIEQRAYFSDLSVEFYMRGRKKKKISQLY